MMPVTRYAPGLIVGLLLSSVAVRAQAPQEEDVARRQYESGLALAASGNHAESVKDFQTVAQAFPRSSVADNALLEIGRYQLDVAGSPDQALATADQIIKTYPTSDSAPHAHILSGRVSLARGRTPKDLDTALASFERVSRLFPESDAVPRALALSGEVLRLQRRNDDALERFRMVTSGYASNPAAAVAHLGSGLTLATTGDPIGAMEEFQHVRDRWPSLPEAAAALDRISTLYRLHVRAKSGVAYAADTTTAQGGRAENIDSLAATRDGTIYFSNGAGVGVVTPATESTPRPPSGTRPRGLTVDSMGRLVVVEVGQLRPQAGSVVPLSAPRPGGSPRPLEKMDGVVAMAGGDWVVADEDERGLMRFDAAGKAKGPFAAGRMLRLAINGFDEVAGIDRESKSVVIFDAGGKMLTRIPARSPGCQLENPADLEFDEFGHLYVLDRDAVCVFDAPAGATATTPPRLLSRFSEPEKNPAAFRRATALALDASGRLFIADERAARVLAYR
jgi:TolA-binding protein